MVRLCSHVELSFRWQQIVNSATNSEGHILELICWNGLPTFNHFGFHSVDNKRVSFNIKISLDIYCWNEPFTGISRQQWSHFAPLIKQSVTFAIQSMHIRCNVDDWIHCFITTSPRNSSDFSVSQRVVIYSPSLENQSPPPADWTLNSVFTFLK